MKKPNVKEASEDYGKSIDRSNMYGESIYPPLLLDVESHHYVIEKYRFVFSTAHVPTVAITDYTQQQ